MKSFGENIVKFETLLLPKYKKQRNNILLLVAYSLVATCVKY